MPTSVFPGRGDVYGPASATDGAAALFDGTTGKLLKVGAAFPATYAVGDLLYASTTSAITGLPDVATGQVLVSGGVNTAPAYSATPTVSRVTLTAGTTAVSAPVITGTQTWNAGGVSFIGTTLAFPETASAAGSRYFQILGGAAGTTDEFYVTNQGYAFVGADFVASATGKFRFGNSGARIQSPSDGVIYLSNAAENSFTRLQLGGTTSSFPAIKRNSGGLEAVLADDSAFTSIKSSSEITSGYLSGARSTNATMQSVTGQVTLSGATTATTNIIPAGATVESVATTTTTTITGATGYQVGDGSDADRWGDKTGTAIGTNTGSTDYTADPRWWTAAARAVTLTAKTSNFTGGVVQVTVFYWSAAGA